MIVNFRQNIENFLLVRTYVSFRKLAHVQTYLNSLCIHSNYSYQNKVLLKHVLVDMSKM